MKGMLLWLILAELQSMNHHPYLAVLSSVMAVVFGGISVVKATIKR